MHTYRIGIISGDGVGREVIPAAQRVLEALPLSLHCVRLEAGWGTFEKTGFAMRNATR